MNSNNIDGVISDPHANAEPSIVRRLVVVIPLVIVSAMVVYGFLTILIWFVWVLLTR